MKWNIASLLTLVVMETHSPRPVDACGVKLTIKSSAPRKAIAHTSHPSEVLLLGNPPHRLERDLSAAGHHVDVAANASAAKKKPYAVVIVDSDLQDEARSNFRGAVVIVRTDDVVADMRSVEKQVAPQVIASRRGGEVLNAGPNRPVTASGPVPVAGRQIVAATESKDVPEASSATVVATKTVAPAAKITPVSEPAPKVVKPTPVEPTRIATTVTPTTETAPNPSAAKTKIVGDEVYFTLGNSNAETAFLGRAERWLKDNADAHVVVEGYADPSGNHDDNMALAQRRAEWVRDSLVTAGIDASRLEVISYGDTRLKYDRTDRRNRRVAITPK